MGVVFSMGDVDQYNSVPGWQERTIYRARWYIGMSSASYTADPGSNPSASTKMECLIFGYGCVGYENDCGEIERTEINIGHRHIKIIAVTAQ